MPQVKCLWSVISLSTPSLSANTALRLSPIDGISEVDATVVLSFIFIHLLNIQPSFVGSSYQSNVFIILPIATSIYSFSLVPSLNIPTPESNFIYVPNSLSIYSI